MSSDGPNYGRSLQWGLLTIEGASRVVEPHLSISTSQQYAPLLWLHVALMSQGGKTFIG